jgi:hypothetical protein
VAIRRTAEEWRGIIEQWQKSGLSAAAFARAHGLRTATFDRWRAAIAKAPVPPDVSFVRLEVARPVAPLVVELGGARIRLERGFDAALLREVLAALAGDGT